MMITVQGYRLSLLPFDGFNLKETAQNLHCLNNEIMFFFFTDPEPQTSFFFSANMEYIFALCIIHQY